MRVLLVIPKKNSRSILPAPDIGIAYVAQAALNAGADVEILDAHKENIGPDAFPDFLKGKHFDLVGFKCLSIDIFTVLDYCKLIKKHNQNIITVLGGPHPSALPEETMKYREFDYVIQGEGESGISSLVKKLMHYDGNISAQDLRAIPNLVYRNNDDIILFNHVVFEEDLDKLDFPAWNLFKIKEYPELPGSGGRFLPILTSRGCPSKCIFCSSNSIHGQRVRTRSPEHVIEEIKWLIQNFDVHKISIFDNNFVLYKKHALAICDLYKKSNFNVKFDIPQGVRIDKIDKELLVALENAGCEYMGIGVESGDQKTLDFVRKGTTIKGIKEKINMIKKYTKIKLIGFFVIGFPNETMADILKTIKFALRLKLDYATFTIFTPFPGTSIFNRMVKDGYFSINTFNWENLLLDRTTFHHRFINHSTLKMLQRTAYLRFYFRFSKANFFFRILIKEASFISYFVRFTSILRK
jgi:anaerobic magnesium-protoporphyrin IX monomethyl ester cyclase